MIPEPGFHLLCRMRFSYLLCIPCIFFISCSSAYKTHRDRYGFTSRDGKPDYTSLNYWAAHPLKWDPSDSTPAPLTSQPVDRSVDVFFIHPTTFTKRSQKNRNAAIDNGKINAKTDYSSILYQASVFNRDARVFAPRYRQAHLRNFYSKDRAMASAAFDLAYEDIKTAFTYYLQNWHDSSPIIIAAHSQGSLLALRLLKDFFETGPLREKLVVAYLIGWPVLQNSFTTLTMCEDSLQTGCLCSWRTLRDGHIPKRYRDTAYEGALATNPLSWKTDETPAGRELNKGSVLKNFRKIYKHTTGARVSGGWLFIDKPRFPGGFFYFTRNYHIADINLFYVNLRENIRQRILSFRANSP